jgi:transcription termination factor Rho
MAVLDRSELEASSLADLHAIANQIGVDGFRRLRKGELIDAILGESNGALGESSGAVTTADDALAAPPAARREPRGRARGSRGEDPSSVRRTRSRGEHSEERADRVVEGVVELLGNGSAFLRLQPPEPSDEDVYISAAQVRRCELVSGDRIAGPVRLPRRSERYPSLVRVDTINGEPADAVTEGARYEDLPFAHPSVRFELGSADPTVETIERLIPIGRGSRALIVGASRAGKSETLRRLLGALVGTDGLECTLVLCGIRPEETTDWQTVALAPAATLTFAASADAQGNAVENAVETAKRVAARGGHALLAIDTLDGLHPHVARKVLAAARNLDGGGSFTLIATATRPFGGESTVIALDVARTSTARYPALDLLHSGTLKCDLLVGDAGAEAIVKARAAELEV